MAHDLRGLEATREDTERDETVDGVPLIGTALLVIGWGVCGEEPLGAFGLSVSLLGKCPWLWMLGVWSAAFLVGRVMEAHLFRPDLIPLVASGTINPGGTYLSLRRGNLKHTAMMAAALTFSQTFVEEFFFRGLAVLGVGRALAGLGVPPAVAFMSAVVASSVAFGLVHFLPMRQATRGKSALLASYALAVPLSLGVVFCLLNEMAGSLWPGWLVHWWLNYSAFVWNKAGGRWEQSPASRSR
jgi:membrane protease YdiL (CAAX protease family)